MKQKVSDYIVQFLIDRHITDVFGYPGGMVTHLMESFDKFSDKLSAHINYHEQASSFAVCGFGQVQLTPSLAYATSGPGATNMLTGICNAFFDSIPSLFITGQVNTYESKDAFAIRQRGFQETDVISMVKSVTNFAIKINDANDIKYYLEKAYFHATTGRKGPVLLDIPMDIQRTEIEIENLRSFTPPLSIQKSNVDDFIKIVELLSHANRPAIIVGAGVRWSGEADNFKKLVAQLKIPVVTSMIAVDILNSDNEYNYGFIGAYGIRYSNFVLAKADLVLSLGSRLDVRQTGANLDLFIPNAKLIRVEIDEVELTRKIKSDELQINSDLADVIKYLSVNTVPNKDFSSWITICDEIRSTLKNHDESDVTKLINSVSKKIKDKTVILADVGQNQVWIAQSFRIQNNQRVLFSGGHGSMGYSLPASLGAYYASRENVYTFNGDGGFMMNIQELQFIVREQIPVKIFILNNKSLGMIRHFQEMYFSSNFVQTVEESGYTLPNFKNIAMSYNIDYVQVKSAEDITEDMLNNKSPMIFDVQLNGNTYVFPKLAMGKLCQDQEPELDRSIYNHLMSL